MELPADAPGSTVQVCFPAVRASVLDSLNRQREEGQLCDLSIHVQGRVFRAHRCVLAASSPYFHDQVLLKNVTTVSLPSVMDPVAFESVLSSAYTGQLSIVQDDIVNYVTVASFLQMWHIVDKCTEILKRPRPAADVPPGGAVSRQQSPSSSDCLYSEREGRRREKRPDALPPLATWRRPQQFPRWGRQKSSAGQQSADSQVDSLPAYDSSDYSSCEEPWVSSQGKPCHFVPDEPGHSSKAHGAPLSENALKQKCRVQPQREPERSSEKSREPERSSEKSREPERSSEKSRESGVSAATQESRPSNHTDAEEVLAAAEKKEGVVQVGVVGQCDVSKLTEGPVVKLNSDDVRDDSDVPGPSARLQWQMPPWPQPPRPPESEDDPDVGHFGDSSFGPDTFDEIEKESGQVTQRPLVSPDFTLPAPDGSWAPPGASLTPTSSSSAFLPPSSPPVPSSSAPFAGKVHYCHCGKAYALKSMRDRHVKMQHLNLRPFGCPVCNKSFKMKHHLTKHLKTHGGLRPFECGVCGKKVIWKDSFLRHQARCQRLAASGGSAADDDSNFSYSFEDGEGFLTAGGHIKVEQGDFEPPDAMILGGVSRIVDHLQTDSVDTHVFKEEANEGFG